MKTKLSILLLMACAIVFAFSSCKKDKVEKCNTTPETTETPVGPVEPEEPEIIQNAVTDIDGNIYNAVKIGDQVWMKENLRTTKYTDGTSIPLGSTYSDDVAYRYCPNNDSSNVSTYGYLYNWPAVMHNSSSSSSNPSGVQGICPRGWHVPSDAEWTQLTNFVSSQSEYVCGNNSSYIAKALASTKGWYSDEGAYTVGNNPSENDATGFSAVPAGYYYSNYGYLGRGAYFWSATEYCGNDAYERHLYNFGAYVNPSSGGKNNGFSVRCLRD